MITYFKKLLIENIKTANKSLMEAFNNIINSTKNTITAISNNPSPQVNFNYKQTGLTNIIWIQPKATDNKTKQHSDFRIKVTDQNHPNAENGIPITLLDYETAEKEIEKLKLTKKQRIKLKKWLKEHWNDLIKYYKNDINLEELKNKIIATRDKYIKEDFEGED